MIPGLLKMLANPAEIIRSVGDLYTTKKERLEKRNEKLRIQADMTEKRLEHKARKIEAQAKVNEAQVRANIAASAHNAKFTFRDYALWSASIAWSLHLFSGVLSWFMIAFMDQPGFPALPHDSQLFYILTGGLGFGAAYRSYEKTKGVSRTCQPRWAEQSLAGAVSPANAQEVSGVQPFAIKPGQTLVERLRGSQR